MSKIFTILLTISFAFSCNQKKEENQTTTTSFDEKSELQAIMQVIDNETKMFFDGNTEGWRSSWSHKNYASQSWNNDDGTADVATGWDAVNAQGSEWIEKYYKNGKDIRHPDYKRNKVEAHFYTDSLAYLYWKQYNADKDKKYYRVSGESRMMEKEKDGWKIVNVTGLWGIEPMIRADSLPSDLN